MLPSLGKCLQGGSEVSTDASTIDVAYSVAKIVFIASRTNPFM